MLRPALMLTAVLFLLGNHQRIQHNAHGFYGNRFGIQFVKHCNSFFIDTIVENSKKGRLIGTNGSLIRARMLIGSVVSGKLPPLLDMVQYFFFLA